MVVSREGPALRTEDERLSDAAGPPPAASARRGETTGRPAAAERAWVGSFTVVLLCQALIFITFSSVMPFLPLYFRELGLDEAGAIAWSGITQSVGAVVMLVAAPLWGTLSDRVGRKPMVLRALGGAAMTLGLMALATQAWHLLVLRAVQGATAGTNAAILALAASILPVSRLGLGMGLLQTSQFLGSSLGPLLGGLASSAFGFRGAFGAAAASIAVIGVVALLVLREPARSGAQTGRGESSSVAQRLRLVASSPSLRSPILAIFAFQTAYLSSMSLLPLHLASLPGAPAGGGASEASALVGLVLTANALGAASGAALLGWLGSRVGGARMALLALAGTTLLTLPQALLTDALQFALLRFAVGVCAGGVLPSLRTVLGERASGSGGTIGAVYGLAQSAFSGGMAVGPPLAALVATTFGLPAIHLLSAAVLAVATAWWLRVMGHD